MFGIDFLMKAMEALESKALHVRPLQCSRLRHQLSTCQRCSSNCPTGAIIWGEALDIDADRCTGCGICANVCPNGVFEANNPDNNTLLKRVLSGIDSSKEITFACAKYQQEIGPEADNVVIVPCLGRIDESILVSCITLGTSSILLMKAFCYDCECKSGWEITMQTTDITNAILDIFGITKKIVFWGNPPKPTARKDKSRLSNSAYFNSERYSRRDFFKAMARETKRATLLATSSMIPTSPANEKTEIRKSGLPFYLPQKRRLLLDAMKKLGKSIRSTVTTDNSPSYQLLINDNCTGCGMCAYFCPTGAIKKTERDGKTSLTFQVSHCTKCNLCRDICHKGAISIVPDINLENLLSDEETILFLSTNGASEVQPSRIEIENIGNIEEQSGVENG